MRLVGLVRKRIESNDVVIIRAITYLQGFDMELIYKRGKDNLDADYLSRLPVNNSTEPQLVELTNDGTETNNIQFINAVVENVESNERKVELIKKGHDGPMGIGHYC